MKHIAAAILSLFLIVALAEAQPGGSVRDRIAGKQTQKKQEGNKSSQLTVRAENANIDLSSSIETAPWMRIVYREIDLTKDKNLPLYEGPTTPDGIQLDNLFTMMFRLVISGEIAAYQYLPDGREIFTDAYRLKVKDFLDNQEIMYKFENSKYVVSEYDIPNKEVQGYYIKEAHYFDKKNSVTDVKLVALCPIMYRQSTYGVGVQRYPLFWLPYDNIRPYARQTQIKESKLNDAYTGKTIDDYFVKRQYEGEIYRTNDSRLLLSDQSGDAATDSIVKMERAKVETELTQFKEQLWATNDSLPVPEKSKKKEKKKKDASDDSTPAKRGESTAKVEAPKAADPPASGSRSARNRRR